MGKVAGMADFVAQAIHRAAAPDEDWNDLNEQERNDFRTIAHAAMAAHDVWLRVNGYLIAKVQKKKDPKPKLITPPKPKLIRLH